MNYRTSGGRRLLFSMGALLTGLTAYGFLASSEVGAEGIGNFGLVDRMFKTTASIRWSTK